MQKAKPLSSSFFISPSNRPLLPAASGASRLPRQTPSPERRLSSRIHREGGADWYLHLRYHRSNPSTFHSRSSVQHRSLSERLVHSLSRSHCKWLSAADGCTYRRRRVLP